MRSSAEPALLPFELLCIFLLPLPDQLPSVFPFPSPLYHSRLAAPHRCQNSSGFTRSSVSYHAIIPWQSLASYIAFVSLVLSSLRHLAFYFCVQISCQCFFPLQPFPQYFGVRNSGRRRTLHFLGTAHTSHRNMPKKKLLCGRSWRTRKRPDARQSFAPPQLLIPTVFFLKVIARNEAAHLEQEACQRHTPLNLWER